MNCRNFENNIRALLRNQSPESAAGEQLLKHAENCRKCAKILEAEKSLSAGFRAAFEDIALEVVSPRIEANLLAAFNSRSAGKSAPAVINISNRVRQRRQTGWAFAAAAVALIVLVCLVGIRQTELIFSGQNQEVLQVSAIPSPPPDLSFPNIDEPVLNPPVEAYKRTNIRPQKSPRSKAAAAASRVKTLSVVKKAVTPDAQNQARFFPLAEADEFISLESGQLVRVEVPVSSLIKLGIPVKAEKGIESVQADLLIGQDGIARAIRPVE